MNLNEMARRFEQLDLSIVNGRVNEPVTTIVNSMVTSGYINYALGNWDHWYTDLSYEFSNYHYFDLYEYYYPYYEYSWYTSSVMYDNTHDEEIMTYEYSKDCHEEDGDSCKWLVRAEYRYREVRMRVASKWGKLLFLLIKFCRYQRMALLLIGKVFEEKACSVRRSKTGPFKLFVLCS